MTERGRGREIVRRFARALFILLCPVWAPLHAGQVQDVVPVLVRVEDRTRMSPRDRVVARDLATGLDREVFRSDGHIPYELMLSPSGRYAAFLEVVGQTGVKRQQLVVLDLLSGTFQVLAKSELHGVRGIQQQVWCCNADRIAIITGLVGEAIRPMNRPIPQSLDLFDIQAGSEQPVEGLPRPLQVAWAAFDSSLYILCGPPPEARGRPGPETWPVYRYHVPTGALSRTTRRGIFFSPDGEYYYHTGSAEGSGFWLYRTADDQEVTARLGVPRHHLGFDATWMPGADHWLVFIEKPAPQPPNERQVGGRVVPAPLRSRVDPDRWNLVVDAATGRVVERFQGDIGSGWKSNAAALPVERRGGVELMRPRRP